jgi:biopolymer transport protein ExbD
LPRGSAKEDNGAPQELVVTVKLVGNEEKFYLNDIPMSKTRVLDEIKKIAKIQKDQWVYIRGDRVVSYGAVTEFVEEMKQVEGVAHVALATQKA